MFDILLAKLFSFTIFLEVELFLHLLFHFFLFLLDQLDLLRSLLLAKRGLELFLEFRFDYRRCNIPEH